MKQRTTRRSVLRTAGVAAAALAGVGTTATAQEKTQGTGSSGWTTAETPTGNTLYDVTYTSAGAYAVGGGGVVLERTDDGWRKLLDGGPTGNGNDLYGAGVTADGERLWFVGASGAIGEYDLAAGTLSDHSAPNDVTNNFNDVAVTGEAGEADVYVAGDSGKIYFSFDNGETGTWNEVTPGSGSAVHALDFYEPRKGHAVDGNQTVFATDDGETWDKLGIEDADYNFYGVDSDGADDVAVSGGGGSVYDWNGSEWVREDNGDPDLRDVEADGTAALAVGAGGAVFRRTDQGWHQESTPVGSNLRAVTDVYSDTEIAVGAGGTVLEH
jgi:hypothetical protein